MTMRIVVQTSFRRKVAGAEAYIEMIVGTLTQHELALLVDEEGPANRPEIALPAGSTIWNAKQLGAENALREVRSWRPDVIYCHGTNDPKLEAETVRIAPAVLMAHNYYGTCISGTKTRQWPTAQPCPRTFGPACLLQYFPRRCGGRNPLTMLRLYREQIRRKRNLAAYRTVLTLSEHMRQEFVKHGLDPKRVVKLPPIGFDQPLPEMSNRIGLRIDSGPRRLLFLGRMEQLKGGQLLIAALPKIAAAVGPVKITFAGDGPAAEEWRLQTRRVSEGDARVSVDFIGWADDTKKEELFTQSELLIVPSIWPEPFGLVGLEAARFGVPSVAFDVGGIRDWLRDGESGLLAPGDPPTIDGLASAMVQVLKDDNLAKRLSVGARAAAETADRNNHVAAVHDALNRAVNS